MKLNRPEIFVVLIILFFGSILVFATPFGAGTDEETHLARIWEMSTGALIPNEYFSKGPYYPFVFYELSYRQDVNLQPISWERWKAQLSVRIDWDNMVNYTTRARYFPIFYLPQAFVMGLLGRVLDTPVAIIYLIERFSYLFLYALLMYLTVRITPVAKRVFCALAVMPMALIQASIISMDALNNGIAFLFIAWMLYLNRTPQRLSFTKKEWGITVLLIATVCTMKLNSLPLLLLLILIPKAKLGNWKWSVAFILLTLFSVIVIGLGWNFYTSSFLVVSETQETFNATEQLLGIFANPLHFVQAIGNNLQTKTIDYLREWIGISGYNYWPLPQPVYWLAPVILLVTMLSDGAGAVVTRKIRITALVTTLLSWFGTMTLFFLLYSAPGSTEIPGIQGRYFIFIGPLAMVALTPSKPALQLKGAGILEGGIALLLGLTVSGLFLDYHIPCGSAYHTPGLCFLPRYKNWSPETSLAFPVSSSNEGKQTFVPVCDQIDEIQLWVKRKGTSADPILIAIQREEDQNNLLIETIMADQIPSWGWISVPTKALSDVGGQNLTIEIRSPGSDETANVELGFQDRNEYLEGTFTLNNQPQEGDLIFRYGCRVGLEAWFE